MLSGIDGKSRFNRHKWLVFLVNTARKSTNQLLGGHSAILIEGYNADHKIILGYYDIAAIKPSHSAIGSHVTNVRAKTITVEPQCAYATYESALDYSDEHRIFARRSSDYRVWPVRPQLAEELHNNVGLDQTRTALGLAQSFFRAHQDRNLDYFECQESLSDCFAPRLAGQTKISQLLHICAGVDAAHRRGDEISRDSLAVGLLEKLSGSGNHNINFLTRNLAKMEKDGFLDGADLIPFRITGPSLTFFNHGKHGEQERPINCSAWCRDHLSSIGIADIVPKDMPKKASWSPSGLWASILYWFADQSPAENSSTEDEEAIGPLGHTEP